MINHNRRVFAGDMKCVLVLASLCGLTLCLQREDLLVSTKVGLIRGLWDEKGYSKFLGIPYGQINNVFGAAVPYPNFDDVFEAYDDSKICPQALDGIPSGYIDCLNMNIFVPDSASSENLLPVMIWIHGGGFVFGSALHEARDPYPLLRHDVIVVAINYRLGVYGFMCLDIPEVPGNTGLKDQLLALRWIKENIEAFGGDPNEITLSGESAGGMSTNLHLLSPYEKLFNRAIIQSGPANSYWMMVESDNTIPFRIAEALNFHTTDINEALNFLSGVDAQTVVLIADNLLITNLDSINQPLTKPCIEKQFKGVENFMVEHPINIKSSKVSTTPIVIGYNNIEFAMLYANIGPEFFESYHFSQHFAMGFNMSNNLNEAMQFVQHFYISDNELSEEDRWEIIDFGSDFIFNHPSHRMTDIFLEQGANTVYNYIFSYDGDLHTESNKNWVGATHAEELPYLFGYLTDENTSAEDLLTIDRFTKLWTNFVKYSDPTPQTSDLLPVIWTPVTNTTQTYLDINSELSVKTRPFNERMAFWDLFYRRFGRYQKWYESND